MTGIAKLIELPEFADARGSLIVAEHGLQLPFAIERVFFVSGVGPNDTRGMHAHHACHQILVCVHGSVTARVDNGHETQTVRLDRPTLGLHMPPLTWGTQWDYSADAVLLVLNSMGYDPKDYIHDYDEFLEVVSAREAAGESS